MQIIQLFFVLFVFCSRDGGKYERCRYVRTGKMTLGIGKIKVMTLIDKQVELSQNSKAVCSFSKYTCSYHVYEKVGNLISVESIQAN